MTMPLIEVHLIEKVFNHEQKRQIIHKLTDAMVSIEGREHARRDLGKDFGSRERRMGHRRPAADHRSCEGTRHRPTRGGTSIRWTGLASGYALPAMLAHRAPE